MIGGVPGTKGVKNGVSLDVYEGEIQEKKCEEEGDKQKEAKRKKKREEKKGKMRKKRERRDSLDPVGSGLSHFEGDFLKF